MRLGLLPGRAILPLITLADVALWADETPIDDTVIFCSDTKTFWYYTEAGGAVDIGAPLTTFETEFFPAAGTASIPANPVLINRTILGFYRDGIKKRVVLGTSSNPDWVAYNFLDGSFSLATGDLFGDEWISIIFSTQPTAV